MRLTLSIFFVGILLCIPAVAVIDTIFERESHSVTATSRVGVPFDWPEHPRAADPEMALRVLAEAAEATGSTVLRTTVNTSGAQGKHITHFVFMGDDRTALFNEFTLATGRWPTSAESRAARTTVSTLPVGDNVGVPAVFAAGYDLTFAPLRQAFDSLPTAGRYVIESRDVGRFRSIVHQSLIAAGVTGQTIEDLTPESGQAPGESRGGLKTLAYVLAGLATIIVVFVLLREGKRIGVFRLLGYRSVRIWYRVVGRLQFVTVFAGLLACVALALIVPGADSFFLRTLATTIAEVAVAGFVATMSAGLIIINRVKVADLVKGGLQ